MKAEYTLDSFLEAKIHTESCRDETKGRENILTFLSCSKQEILFLFYYFFLLFLRFPFWR
jgi:hypothetical protein